MGNVLYLPFLQKKVTKKAFSECCVSLDLLLYVIHVVRTYIVILAYDKIDEQQILSTCFYKYETLSVFLNAVYL